MENLNLFDNFVAFVFTCGRYKCSLLVHSSVVYAYRQRQRFRTFDLFNGMRKQHHVAVLDSFLNGTKNDSFDGTCTRGFTPKNGLVSKFMQMR